MPSGDCATVKPYCSDTRRHTSETQLITHHNSVPAMAARPAGDTNARTIPASTSPQALPEADNMTDPIRRPVGTTTAICSASSGVAGSMPWWAASRRALSSSAACSVR